MVRRGKFLYGFTLIELIIVIVIIGIMASLALPRYQKAIENSRKAEAYTILKAIHGAQMRYAIENDAYTNNPANLDINVTTGKFFSFAILYSNPNLSPTDGIDQTLAMATRLTDGHPILINESGAIWEP